MTITCPDGKASKRFFYRARKSTMRVAVEGAEDAMELSNVRGIWVSDECEPLSIQFAGPRHQAKPALSEDDFCRSHECAARPIHLLFAGDAEGTIELNAPVQTDPMLFASPVDPPFFAGPSRGA
jgi:hypothetical protein